MRQDEGSVLKIKRQLEIIVELLLRVARWGLAYIVSQCHGLVGTRQQMRAAERSRTVSRCCLGMMFVSMNR